MDKNLQFLLLKSAKFLITAVFILLFYDGFAQVKFSAAVNNKTIGKNEFLQIQFTVENAADVETITPPSFKNFAVVSGPNHQSSMTNYNGRIKQSLSIGFVLQPLTTGNFTIGSAIAKAEGKEYHSSPVKVSVTNTSSSASRRQSNLSPYSNLTLDFPNEPVSHQFDDYILKKNENVAEKIKRNLFIRIEASKKSCYVGEPIIATYKLYTRLKSESNVLKAPSFNGFSVSELEMPDNYQLRIEKYNGREYNVYTLRKVQLYPLQSGILSLEPIEVKNRVTFLKSEYAGARRGDIFLDLLREFADETSPGEATEEQIITITGDTVNINVKPLPEANKPSSFKGAVGDFKMVAALEKNNITTDDAGSLKVVIQGSGNIQMINSPAIQWPTGVEGFESKSAENIEKFSVPMRGEKVFVFPFTVTKPGDYVIPAINFSYFDVSSQSYKTASTQHLSFNVKKGTGVPKFFNVINKENLESKGWYQFIANNQWYLIGGGILLTAFLVLFIRKKNQEKLVPVAAARAEIIPEQPEETVNNFIIPANALAGAENKLAEGDSREFYKVLDLELHQYLSQILKVPAEELSKKKINERMDKCNVAVGTTLLVNSLLEDIELNLYAPVTSTSEMQEVYEKASEVVSLLDKQIC